LNFNINNKPLQAPMENKLHIQNKPLSIATDSPVPITLENTPVPISIKDQPHQAEIVKELLAFMLEKPTLRSMPDEIKFLLSSYVYDDDMKKYIKNSVTYACIVGNTQFIEAFISAMKERNLESELDLVMRAVYLELFN